MTEVAKAIASTPLEFDLLANFHARYSQLGFLPPEAMHVKSRQTSSAGRFTYFEHEGSVQLADGQLGLGLFSQFDMAGIEAGASFWIQLAQGKVLYLEIIVNGEEPWDGSESNWVVLDPDSGDCPGSDGRGLA